MIRISYPLKVLLIATVISLLPVTLGVSPLDYKGNSLEAAEDEKKKKKREDVLNYLVRRCKGFFKRLFHL